MSTSSHLTPEQIDTFKKVLQKLLKRVEGDIQESGAEMHQALPQNFRDAVVDREELEIVEIANQVETVEADQIQDALQRIGSGDFGICQKCLKPVGYQRLRAMPYAKFCITCQEENEQK